MRRRICLIPQPQKMREADGQLAVSDLTEIVASQQRDRDLAVLLSQRLFSGTGHYLPVVEQKSGNGRSVVLSSDADLDASEIAEVAQERYELTVDSDGVVLQGATPAALSRAVATFKQLLPSDAFRRGGGTTAATIPFVSIEDQPRLRWRGMMIDTVRHFQPKAFILDLIDQAWLHRMNVVQLHLTDDQGWRIDIPSRPKLREVSAWRSETVTGHALLEGPGDGTPHGGYYTLDDLREIVAYARQRHITVVPEINMPGHTRAALAAYPELGLAEKQPVATTFGVFFEVLEPTEETLKFSEDVFAVVTDVFDSPVIHIGGDEVPLEQWEKSSNAAEIMSRHGYDDLRQVQGWFAQAFGEQLAKHGRRIAGWDEVLGAGAPNDTIVTVWRNEGYAVRAADKGYDAIVAPEPYAYLDHYESEDTNEPLRIHGQTSVGKIEKWDPVPEGLDGSQIYGAQCQLWAEYLPTPRDVEYALFPRLAAFSDAAWSEMEVRQADPVSERIAEGYIERLEAQGVNHRPLDGPLPWQQGGTGVRRRWDRTYVAMEMDEEKFVYTADE
ncbi:beta-N-acetylhexosaminidase [Haloglycomyces albus]|uniref:beta-N-acetylhexosaminidase n=1 Tax=Haloglycomyces albus TaxID=526067 RepID=UPI00046CBDD9|nr:beta-N-acetylhexosaminidase [Haloglycomyces albus]